MKGGIGEKLLNFAPRSLAGALVLFEYDIHGQSGMDVLSMLAALCC